MNDQITNRCGEGRWDCRAFTLIEMMMAVAILVVITVTVYQFTDVTLRATEVSVKSGEEAMQCGGFRRLLASQLAALPAGESGSLIGVKNKGVPRRDAMQMVVPAGNGVLTPEARGYYQVTLDLREIPRGSGHFALGMERQPWTDDDEDDEDDDNALAATKLKVTDVRGGKAPLPSDWVLLMDNVKALEIAYFDARLNGWVDAWPDASALPNLVRVRLSILGATAPYEIVERVPGGGLAKVIPAAAASIINGVNGRAGTGGINNGQNGALNRPGAIPGNQVIGVPR